MIYAGFLLLGFYVVKISAAPLATALKSENVVFEIQPDFIVNGGNQAALNGVVFKTVIRYHCTVSGYDQNSSTILYGRNGWSFPVQDVNLTLSYPSPNLEIHSEYSDLLTDGHMDGDYYRISGYQVLLFTDGSESTGTIAAGGLMQDHITLNFVMSRITMLSYEFWLYGVPARAVAETNYQSHDLCA